MSADAMAHNCERGKPVNGSLPFGGDEPLDGGGLTKVTPCTVGVTDGLTVVVGGLVGLALAGHALLLAVDWLNPWKAGVADAVTRSRSGIGGGGVDATPGLSVMVTTMVSETAVPCARASAPNVNVAAVAAAALSTSVAIETRRCDPTLRYDLSIAV
jgi:hypothetical protein